MSISAVYIERVVFGLLLGNELEKALNKIGREDIVKKCIFNVELVTDDMEKAVARVRLDQPGFDSLKEELGPSRDQSLRRDVKMDPKMDLDYESDRMKVIFFYRTNAFSFIKTLQKIITFVAKNVV